MTPWGPPGLLVGARGCRAVNHTTATDVCVSSWLLLLLLLLHSP
jgi:hypothetical protein